MKYLIFIFGNDGRQISTKESTMADVVRLTNGVKVSWMVKAIGMGTVLCGDDTGVVTGKLTKKYRHSARSLASRKGLPVHQYLS